MVRFSVRDIFRVRVMVRVIQVAILSRNCEATQTHRYFKFNRIFVLVANSLRDRK